jgi:hypothetical protein
MITAAESLDIVLALWVLVGMSGAAVTLLMLSSNGARVTGEGLYTIGGFLCTAMVAIIVLTWIVIAGPLWIILLMLDPDRSERERFDA